MLKYLMPIATTVPELNNHNHLSPCSYYKFCQIPAPEQRVSMRQKIKIMVGEIIYFQTTNLKTLHFKEFRLCKATTEHCLQKQAQYY